MITEATKAPSEYLTPEQVCEIVPGMTKSNLAQLRFKGQGPTFYKPSPRLVIYKKDAVIEWIESTARTGTAEGY